MNKKTNQVPLLAQFVINLVIPLVILTRFSDEGKLGATGALLLALAFPVVYELYNVRKRRKFSLVSALAIGGILVTGVIGLLGLSEGWLAVRRSVPYLAMAAVLIVSAALRRPVLSALLPHILEMGKINAAAQKKRTSSMLEQSIRRSGYILGGVLLAIAAASYVLTRVMITGDAGTSVFNQEYARLRVVSLVGINVLLFVSLTAAIYYLGRSIEKLTGLDIDDLMKKE
jgi:intracellular septation protein A